MPIRILLLAVILLVKPLQSQYIKIGSGYISGTIAGPFSASTSRDTQYSKFAYIFPKSVLGNLIHGDTITSIEIFRVGGGLPDSNCIVNLYMGNTNRSDFGSGKVSFSTELSNARWVGTLKPAEVFNTMEKFYPLVFSNQYRYDSLLGENLTLFVEYKQWKKQPVAMSFYIETPSSVIGYANNQTKYLVSTTNQDSLSSSTSFHPTIVFNFPKFQQDVAVIKAYTLGKIPLPLGKPDSVQVLVKNVGKSNLNNYWLKTYSIGKNRQQDSFRISLNVGEEKFFQVPSLNPKIHSQDTIYVESSDINSSNNTSWSVRLGNPNVYSYRDITLSPAPGGIGFNGSTGDFVAKFYSASNKFLNQVTVVFGGSGVPFRIGIWEQNKSSRLPGKLVYQSDSLISKSGNYILDFKKPITVNGTFYVGVRQLNTSNVAFGYQMEEPVRPNSFFYAAPLGDTNWVDFHPDAPYKFLIEPRLQADYDFACISADFPKDTINAYVTDTLAPKATFGNVGVFKPKDSAVFTVEIFAPNGRVYKESVRDTLRSGGRRTYTFPKTFYPKNLGEYKMIAYSSHGRDSIRDNDTQVVKFYVGVKQDVGVTTVYDPVNNQQYEYKTDTLMPVATISNIGYDNIPSFVARCVIYKGNKTVYNESQSLALPKFQSKILFWKTYKFQDTGTHRVAFITEYSKDAYRKNDTIIRLVYVFKLVDVGVDSIKSPDNKQFYVLNKPITPSYYFFNDGAIKAYSIPVYCKIYDPSGKLIFVDSVRYDMEPYDGVLLSWGKSFLPKRKGLHTMVISTRHFQDKFKDNDSISSFFTVGFPYEVEVLSVVNPIKNKEYTVGYESIKPKILLRNNGFIKSSGPIVLEIYHSGKKVHTDIQTISIDTGKTDTVVFSKFFRAQKVGAYDMIVYFNGVDENYRKNDTASTVFTATIGRDALPINYKLFPLNSNYNVGDTLQEIRVFAGNQGKDSITKVVFNCAVYSQGKELYKEFKTIDLAANSEDSISFFSELFFAKPGFYFIEIQCSSLDDQNPFNDTLLGEFSVIVKQDLALLNFNNPGINDLPDSTTLWQPHVFISNKGESDSTSLSSLIYQIRSISNNSIVFADTTIVPKVGPGDTVEIAFKSFKTETPDAYLIESFINKPIDLIAENDTLRMPYILEKNSVYIQGKNVKTTIFPNPVSDKVTINSSHPNYTISLVDAMGKKVYQGKSTNSVSSLLTESYSNGIYLITIESKEGVFSQKILIQH
ncbi:MAG: T9SS type A sorting domain-containing protein [Bacteroidota bacterium]|jgi:hypothetical protein